MEKDKQRVKCERQWETETSWGFSFLPRFAWSNGHSSLLFFSVATGVLSQLRSAVRCRNAICCVNLFLCICNTWKHLFGMSEELRSNVKELGGYVGCELPCFFRAWISHGNRHCHARDSKGNGKQARDNSETDAEPDHPDEEKNHRSNAAAHAANVDDTADDEPS